MSDSFISELNILERHIEAKGVITWDLSNNETIDDKWETFSIHKITKFGISWSTITPKEKDVDLELLIKYITTKMAERNNSTAMHLFVILSLLEIDLQFPRTIWESYFDSLPKDHCEKLMASIVESVNRLDWFSGSDISKKPETLSDWERLVNQIQYAYDLLYSPSKAIVTLLEYLGDRYLGYVFENLNSVIFASLVGVPPIGSYFWKFGGNIPSLLEQGILSDVRVAVFLKRMSDKEALTPNEELLGVLISKFWPTIGKALFRRAFTLWWKNNSNERPKPFEVEVGNTISNWIDSGDTGFLASFEWPPDYIALSGFYFRKNTTNGANIDLPSESVSRELSNALFKQWDSFHLTPEILEGFRQPGELEAILEPQGNMALSIASYSILFCCPSINGWEKKLKSFIFELRPLFYSSFEIVLKVREYVAFLLAVLLIPVDFRPLSELACDRIKQALGMISSAVLYPFISSYELSEDIWNAKRLMTNDRWEPNSQRIYFVNLQLSKISTSDNPDIQRAYKEFLELWRSTSSAKWPWMYADWPITKT
jgi:hypothetical protein